MHLKANINQTGHVHVLGTLGDKLFALDGLAHYSDFLKN